MKRARVRAQGQIGASLLCALLAGGCAELPSLPAGTCGNGVIEQDEDCDTFALDQTSLCRPAGSAGACHLDCSLGRDGTRAPCPAGWGCDESDLCRAPTGAFAAPINHEVGAIAALLSGDFDGDGRAEVVSREPPDSFDTSQLTLHYFDERGALLESRAFPKPVASPLLVDLSRDQRSDLLFSNFQVGLLLGRADRRFVPETFSSYRIADSGLRVLGVFEHLITLASSLVVLSAVDGVPGYYVPDSNTGRLRNLGPLPSSVEDIVGDPVGGNIIDVVASPCDEVLVAVRGARSFWLADVCERAPVTSAVSWRDKAEQREVALAPAATIDTAPLIADIDGDGHLDVLIGAEQTMYVAYGDGQRLADAIPYDLSIMDTNPLARASFPLAAGDFTGDGAVDFLFEDRIVISRRPFGGGAPGYETVYGNLGARWTVAKIGDLNGNGKVDVVAASSQGVGIDFFNGTGSEYFIPTSLVTQRPVTMLGIGDFDGDLTNDLAFLETAASDAERDSLSIAFGVIGRPPESPVPVARLQNPEQLSVYSERGLGNMVVSSLQTAPTKFGSLTLLDGSPDRIPFAPFTLVSFSEDGFLRDYPALALTSGAFSAAGHADVLALASDNFAMELQFWLVPDLQEAQGTPLRLIDGALDQRLLPISELGGSSRFRVASAAGDFDHDGRDEALWAMPSRVAGQCGLLRFSVETRGGPRLVAPAALMLDEPCQDPQLAALDVDSDGALDIALLTGASGGSDRKLIVLWNDGAGGFSAEDAVQVNEARHSPQAFAALPATTLRSASLVYVTQELAVLTSLQMPERSFSSARELTSLTLGSGVVAADFNGDGAQDLAIADAGDLTLLLAELRSR